MRCRFGEDGTETQDPAERDRRGHKDRRKRARAGGQGWSSGQECDRLAVEMLRYPLNWIDRLAIKKSRSGGCHAPLTFRRHRDTQRRGSNTVGWEKPPSAL